MRIFVASVMNEVEMVFEGAAASGSDTRGGSFYIREARCETGFLRHNP